MFCSQRWWRRNSVPRDAEDFITLTLTLLQADISRVPDLSNHFATHVSMAVKLSIRMLVTGVVVWYAHLD